MLRYLYYIILSMPFVGAYAMFAVGIVVIYRASRVLNLAHGAMAMVPAYVTYSVSEAGMPIGVAVVAGVASGAVIGLLVERIFVRGLRHMSVTAQTVGTVAVLSLLIALAAKVWGTVPRTAPSVFPKGFIPVGSGRLQYGGIGLFAVAVVLAVVMLLVFRFTNLGLAMRGSAENRRAASLMGINPERTTAIAWVIGGALAAVSGILLAAITTLSPFDLPLQTLPAFVAALLGGIDSVIGALGGSSIVGLLLGIVPATSTVPVIGRVTGQTGGPELALTIAALGVMYFRGSRFSVATRDDGGFASGSSGSGRVRRKRMMPAPIMLLIALALVGWVWVPKLSSFAVLANVSQSFVYILVGISLVVLTGWVGQISLGHAALVGIGAFGTGLLFRDFGIPFPFNLPLAGLLSASAAVLLGAVALRVRGLYLAVATLIFSWMADSFLFRAPWFVGSGGSSTIETQTFGVQGGFPYFDLSSRRTLYYFGLAVTLLALLAVANLRSSKTGRAFFAVRGSEIAAASLGINVMRYKLLAFGISGMLAGIAGNLTIIDQRTIISDTFKFTVSLFFLSIAVVGGLTSISGVVVASLLFALLNYLFTTLEALGGLLDILSAGLLVAAILVQAHRETARKVLMKVAQPLARFSAPISRPIASVLSSGVGTASKASAKLAGLVQSVKMPKLRGIVPTRRGSKREPRPPLSLGSFKPFTMLGGLLPRKGRGEPGSNGTEAPVSAEASSSDRIDAPVVIEGRNITVQFGGLVAVCDASIQIRKGEIVGLIGPNGAGKTTLFNALSGLNEPTRGTVRMGGKDVSSAPVHERAKLGLGRTFQVLQLFGDLTVRENLMVATHVHNRTGFLRHMLATDAAVQAEREAHKRVAQVLEILELEEFADRPAAGLPFGILRLVELGRAVVTEAPLILLDEAASGLDNTETDRFTDFLRSLRERMGISMLLIEHDVRMVTGVSDYMYVLNMGQLIAEGRPDQVQRDPAVIAAYLGEPEDEATSSEALAEPAAV